MLGRLFEAIDELDAIDPITLTDGELHELTVGMQKANSLFALACADVLAVWETRRCWADDGSKAAHGRLSRECGLAPGTAKRALCRARKLQAMPATVTALREGKLSVDHADLLARVNQPNVETLFARDEALLVDQIKAMRYADATRVVKYWQQAAWDGEQHGRNATADQLARTASERRADAIVEMARRSAAMPESAQPARPLFTVLAGYGAFSRLCEMADGTVIAPGQLIPHLSEADIERIVFEGPSEVIDVGVRERFFTGALRRAIEVRDRHCQHPSGCDVPARDCEIDHIIPYSQGGLTRQGNGRCCCKVHNRRKGNRPDPTDE